MIYLHKLLFSPLATKLRIVRESGGRYTWEKTRIQQEYRKYPSNTYYVCMYL